MSFSTIDEYINTLDMNKKSYINEFVVFMKTSFPKITPEICYSMPMWCVGAKMYNGYVAVSAADKHYSVHFLDESYIIKLKEMLPNCSFGKRCINIKYGDDQTIAVVMQVVNEYLSSIL